jgi:serine/threonine protein kinase
MAASLETICNISTEEFNETYTIFKSILGTGGYSTVLRGKNKITGQHVAIKVIPLYIKKEEYIKELQKECTILSSLDHPNIMKIYGGVKQTTRILWIMEALKGEVLDKIRENNYYLSEKTVRHLFKQMLSAVNYCHRRDIIHGDIKLENMVFKRKCSVEDFDKCQLALIDFGFASEQKNGELFYKYRGSPVYSSPEILNNIPYSGRKADIWALGVCLNLLADSHLYPFYPKDESLTTLIRLINDKNVLPNISDNVSPQLRFLIENILQRDPKDRFSLKDIRESEWMNMEL